MARQFNPLIHNHTTDTLAHTRDVLTLLQVVFSSCDTPSTESDPAILGYTESWDFVGKL